MNSSDERATERGHWTRTDVVHDGLWDIRERTPVLEHLCQRQALIADSLVSPRGTI